MIFDILRYIWNNGLLALDILGDNIVLHMSKYHISVLSLSLLLAFKVNSLVSSSTIMWAIFPLYQASVVVNSVFHPSHWSHCSLWDTLKDPLAYWSYLWLLFRNNNMKVYHKVLLHLFLTLMRPDIELNEILSWVSNTAQPIKPWPWSRFYYNSIRE